jgi:hypothetical protein
LFLTTGCKDDDFNAANDDGNVLDNRRPILDDGKSMVVDAIFMFGFLMKIRRQQTAKSGRCFFGDSLKGIPLKTQKICILRRLDEDLGCCIFVGKI